MERPSHIIFEQHQPFSRRVPLVATATGLQLAGFWLFTHELASGIVRFVPGVIELAPIPENPLPPVKPPEPKMAKKIELPFAREPEFTTQETPKGGAGIVTTLPQGNEGGGTAPRENIIRAAAGIPSTHTVPPYPPVERRVGAEGSVTLRLTVSAEGRVTQAEIVTSSGRDELDQTARQWILAHWAYRPALENGAPVVSHVLATMTFSLASGR